MSIMEDLESLKASLRKLQQQLANKKAEKQKYLNTASDIKAVYDRMAEDKKTIKGYRDSVKTFGKETYTTFKGNLYSEAYKTKVEALVENYNTVISNLDTNMDRLNTVRAQYENKAYQCNGPIGYLQSAVNSLMHTIQNWVN